MVKDSPKIREYVRNYLQMLEGNLDFCNGVATMESNLRAQWGSGVNNETDDLEDILGSSDHLEVPKEFVPASTDTPVVWLGTGISNLTGYIYFPATHHLKCVTREHMEEFGSFAFAKRIGSSLVLVYPENSQISIPRLANIKFVILAAGNCQNTSFRIDQYTWNHYQALVIDIRDKVGTPYEVSLGMSHWENLLVEIIGGDLILFDAANGKFLRIRKALGTDQEYHGLHIKTPQGGFTTEDIKRAHAYVAAVGSASRDILNTSVVIKCKKDGN